MTAFKSIELDEIHSCFNQALNHVANSQYHLAVAGGSNIADCRFLIADKMFPIRSIGNWQSTIGNDCAPTRYREVVLTVCYKIEATDGRMRGCWPSDFRSNV